MEINHGVFVMAPTEDRGLLRTDATLNEVAAEHMYSDSDGP